MSGKHRFYPLWLAFIVLFMVGCARNTPPATPSIAPTATQTNISQAELTTATATSTLLAETLESTNAPTSTSTPITEDLTPTETPTKEPTAQVGSGADQSTPTPTPTETTQVTADCQEKAAFFGDITVPDGTFFNQGESFTKTWRFRNEGTCTWDSKYALVFASGDNMSAPLEVPFSETVSPGGLVDLSVDMKAPMGGGPHQSVWEFKNPAGMRFGVGASGKDQFWAQISVRYLDQNDQPQPDPSTLPPPTTPAGCNAQRNESFESQVVALIAQVRSQNGLNALVVNDKLTAAALAHSVDMACNDYVGHTGTDGSTWTDRITVQDYAYSYATENIYVGFPEFGGTPDGAFNWWMNSQVHRDNILDPKVTEIGIGYVYTDNSSYGGYYTIDFARP
jgi:uncharacterized protein YkwD